jgi:type II restriction enzyme
MRLEMRPELATGYKSRSQQARVISEAWGLNNLFCPRCDSPTVEGSKTNAQVVDFGCPKCSAQFQLKCQSHPFSQKVVDSAYEAMRRAIEQRRTPHLLAMEYDLAAWKVNNLTLIPSFALTLSCLEKRKPLSLGARRSGWVGCNILLSMIPPDARIPLVSCGVPARPSTVRQQYALLHPLETLDSDARGWTLDVLNAVRLLGKTEFVLSELYDRADHFQRLHPNNRHVREKIRQQLQRLRDLGLLDFGGRGTYRLKREQLERSRAYP